MRNPEAGGAEVQLHETLVRMVERGHRVTLFASRYPGATEFDAYDGIDVVRHGNWWSANFAVPAAVKAFLRRERADLIIEDINKIPFLMPWHTDVPVLVMIPHLFGTTVYRETNPVLATYVYLWELLIPRVYRNCRFQVVSESTRQDLVSRGIDAGQIDVVLNGLDHGIWRRLPGVDKDARPTLVHFGRARKYKGIDIVIRAFAKVRERLADARLVVIGDGPALPGLRALAGSLGLSEAVEFTGFLPIEEVVERLNRSHVCLNGSPKEGWGLTVVEANACGVPVVGADRPGLRDSILDDQTGFLVPYGDADAFAQRALELLTDTALRQRMAAAGMEWASTMTWDRCANEMEQLFLEEARSA